MKRFHYTEKYLLNPTHPITINLIGVGGTGSQVLTSLARIDHALYKLGHPGLYVHAYDPDIVSESNIGRQLFSQSDVGINKAVVLITRLNRFFGTAWKAVPEKYEYNPVNITITCVDNVKSRLDFHQKSTSYDIKDTEPQFRPLYWLDFGNMQKSGQVILGTIQEVEQPILKDFEVVSCLPTIADEFDLTIVKDENSGPSCSLAEALTKQDLFINSTLAQLGSALLWKLISTGSVNYRGAFLNLETMNVNCVKL